MVYRGVNVPKLDDDNPKKLQEHYCSMAICGGTCDNCLFDFLNIEFFEEWLKEHNNG